MEGTHLVAIAAIPATLLVVAQAVQGTAQSIDAIDDPAMKGDEARKRIRSMSWFAAAALIMAALATGIRSNDLSPVLTTFVTAAIVVYMFNRITLPA